MIRRVFDILESYNDSKLPVALSHKVQDSWVSISGEQYVKSAEKIALGLLHLGFKKGEKAIIISNNRYEYNCVDMALAQAGIVSIPIFPKLPTDNYDYIIKHSEPSLIFVSDKILWTRLEAIIKDCPTIREIFSFNKIENVQHFSVLEKLGEEHQELLPTLEEIKKSIQPKELFTIVYTSSESSDKPRGVMLSHDNIVQNVLLSANRNPLPRGKAKAISFLSISHIYERIINYHCQYLGFSIYYSDSNANIHKNILQIKPDMLSTAPSLVENIYSEIIAKASGRSRIYRKIYARALHFAATKNLNEKLSFFERLRKRFYEKTVYANWLKSLGGNLSLVVSGGTSLPTKLTRLFHNVGINIIEGYGMTETSPIIAVTDLRRGAPKPSTVGFPLENLDVKLAEDGEILCKGHNVMMGYYKEPELTAQVIDEDGYFHTGDIGHFTEDGQLIVLDRKNDIFKLADQTPISPLLIENALRESLLINQAMVIGANQEFPAVLISPSLPNLYAYCTANKIAYDSTESLMNHPAILTAYYRIISKVSAALLPPNAQLITFRIIPNQWSPQTGELSPVLKLKRHKILEKYRHVIDTIYTH